MSSHRFFADCYLPGDCPNCGRRRLEFVLENRRANEGEEDPTIALVGIHCEKCLMFWELTDADGEANGIYDIKYRHGSHPLLRKDPPRSIFDDIAQNM